MARDPKRRQKALQRKAAKRKKKRSQLARQVAKLAGLSLKRAKDWPLHEVWLTEDWREPENLVQIVVARRAPMGHIAMGVFLVDLGCLGVKNAFGRVGEEAEYRAYIRGMQEGQDLMPADLNLVAKILREAVAYARTLGFRPNRDYGQALQVLGNADPDACDVDIPLGGDDGKPFYFAGPYDDVERIMRKLENAVGPDGFTYVIPITDEYRPDVVDSSVEFADDDLFDDEDV